MAVLEKETFEVPCRIYGCNKRAKYRICNPTGSPSAFFHLCEDCATSIMNTLPSELQPTPIEVEKIVEKKIYPDIEEMKAIVEGTPKSKKVTK